MGTTVKTYAITNGRITFVLTSTLGPYRHEFGVMKHKNYTIAGENLSREEAAGWIRAARRVRFKHIPISSGIYLQA